MSGFPAKLMAAVVLIFLFVGGFPATSASFPWGIGKSSFLASVRKDGSMKTLPLEEGSSKGLNIKSKKIVFSRSLRVPQPPPTRPGNPGPRNG
ncbi:hypothetical protein CMV_028295 [Castanea mollissima]|uniref:Transmembrane protein n=1 Tax=Castanea mollissima TaxID=60419 RepID=A0A8J4VC90_9ROSI|nr:hypothetical protein CMV_028295 [Castanea mollissima]